MKLLPEWPNKVFETEKKPLYKCPQKLKKKFIMRVIKVEIFNLRYKNYFFPRRLKLFCCLIYYEVQANFFFAFKDNNDIMIGSLFFFCENYCCVLFLPLYTLAENKLSPRSLLNLITQLRKAKVFFLISRRKIFIPRDSRVSRKGRRLMNFK